MGQVGKWISESKWVKRERKGNKGKFLFKYIASERVDKEKLLLNRNSAGIVQIMCNNSEGIVQFMCRNYVLKKVV